MIVLICGEVRVVPAAIVCLNLLHVKRFNDSIGSRFPLKLLGTLVSDVVKMSGLSSWRGNMMVEVEKECQPEKSLREVDRSMYPSHRISDTFNCYMCQFWYSMINSLIKDELIEWESDRLTSVLIRLWISQVPTLKIHNTSISNDRFWHI